MWSWWWEASVFRPQQEHSPHSSLGLEGAASLLPELRLCGPCSRTPFPTPTLARAGTPPLCSPAAQALWHPCGLISPTIMSSVRL